MAGSPDQSIPDGPDSTDQSPLHEHASTDQSPPHESAVRPHDSRGEDAYAAGGLIELEPITHIDALRVAVENGHPVLHDVDHLDWGQVFSETLSNDTTAAGSVSARVERFSAHSVAVDRLRAAELAQMASAVLSLALSTEDASERVARLFEPAAATSPADGHEEPGAFSPAPLPTDVSPDGPDQHAFCTRAEYILNTAEETAISARVDSRLGNTRRLIGQAVTAYVGTPLLLRALLEGRLRFNRWEAVIRKFAWLPLAHLHALDEYIAGLDPRFSLHQFMRKVGEFVAGIAEKPVLAARARKGRDTWVEDLTGGEAILCLKGPSPLIHARHKEGEAIARAAVRGQVVHLDVTPVEKTVITTDDVACADQAGAQPPGATTPMSATDDLPPLSSLSMADERTVRQLTFDALISARPRTETVLEEVDTGKGTTTRYRVEIACPDDATVLRKHAAVVVTVPMTTLLGVDDRPGMIAGAPVPADMARMIASKSTVWYRMLTDPATGQVLDEAALKYEPDRATRIAVQGKWQTCTAPGCARPAQHCEIDHGVPFNHHHPERGGRTEPANLHPLCKRHHQAKTEGTLRMRRTGASEIEWLMPIGTTSTAIAPSVDDGGILSVACSPDGSPERADARRVISERTVTDPVTGQKAADAVYARLWVDFVAEQEAWDRSAAQRNAVRDELNDTREKLEAQVEQQRRELAEREARVDRKAYETLLRDDRITRDQRILALQRARWEQLQRQQEREREGGGAGGSDPASGSPAFKTIIPMRVEEFTVGPRRTVSMHSPIFPRPASPTSADKDAAAELFSSDRRRHRAVQERREPTDGDGLDERDEPDEWDEWDEPNESDEPDVRGYEIRGRERQKVSRVMDGLASAIYDREESRALYLTIAFNPAAQIDHPRQIDRTRLFGRPEATDVPRDGAEDASRKSSQKNQSDWSAYGDSGVPPPF